MKAILITEMPTNCVDCQYCGWATHDEDMRACMLLNGYFFNEEEVETKRSEVCPLKPMPEKIEEGEEPNIKYGISEYAVGRNDCIEEIEKC